MGLVASREVDVRVPKVAKFLVGGVAVSKARGFGQYLELIGPVIIARQGPFVRSPIESRLAGRALVLWWAVGAVDGWCCSESIAGIDLARELASFRPFVAAGRSQLRRRCRRQDAEEKEEFGPNHLFV